MKSHVSIEQYTCPICGTTFDSGALLLDTRVTYNRRTRKRKLRESLETKTTTGYDLCPECATKDKDGYIAMVVATGPGNDTLKMEDANRTGEIIHMRRSAAKQMLTSVDSSLKMVFITPEAANTIKELVNER